MIIHKTYQFRLKPTKEQEALFWRFSGHCRFIWNYFWKINKIRLDNKQKIMKFYEMRWWMVRLKESQEYSFLRELNSQSLVSRLRELDNTYWDCFLKRKEGAQLPVIKKRSKHNSFHLPDPKKQAQVKGNKVKLSKIGEVTFFKSRKIDGEIRTARVFYRTGYWYISFQVKQEIDIPKRKDKGRAGIYLGGKNLLTLVTNKNKKERYDLLNIYGKYEPLLKKKQKSLKRKVSFSKNWEKKQAEIKKIHRKIFNTRRDTLHKISTEVCKNHATIYLSDFRVLKTLNKGRLKKKEKEKNKKVLDQGLWYLKEFIVYKGLWRGNIVKKVNNENSILTCSSCGVINDTRQGEKFCCNDCGLKESLEINAAKNILAAGHAVTVCEANQLRN